MLKVTGWLADPYVLLAPTTTTELPTALGVPEITPVVETKDSPAGRPGAL
jgi:hypothetical protein